MKTLYFAHSKRTYDTLSEKEALYDLRNRFGEGWFIFCPNTADKKVKMWDERTDSEDFIMTRCLEVVDESKLVVVMEYERYIGKGVYTEVMYALDRGIPVLVIHRGTCRLVTGTRLITNGDWAVKYGKLIVGPVVTTSDMGHLLTVHLDG